MAQAGTSKISKAMPSLKDSRETPIATTASARAIRSVSTEDIHIVRSHVSATGLVAGEAESVLQSRRPQSQHSEASGSFGA
jgi:hypothetical protein